MWINIQLILLLIWITFRIFLGEGVILAHSLQIGGDELLFANSNFLLVYLLAALQNFSLLTNRNAHGIRKMDCFCNMERLQV